MHSCFDVVSPELDMIIKVIHTLKSSFVLEKIKPMLQGLVLLTQDSLPRTPPTPDF